MFAKSSKYLQTLLNVYLWNLKLILKSMAFKLYKRLLANKESKQEIVL